MSTTAPRTRTLPTGTVTFLRTDVEGSMGLLRQLGRDWDEINEIHLTMLRADVERNGGICIRTEGDALFAAFPEASVAVRAAVDGQRSLAARQWPAGVDLRVRMGLHTGAAHLSGDDYGGFEVNRAARVAAIGHGGQVILSATTTVLVADDLPTGVRLRDLGRHILKDVASPEQIHQLEIPGLRSEFPALRTGGGAGLGDLPGRLTSFLGRERELIELDTLVEANRLLTLTGPGGIGKTSLAVELARATATRMPDGAWFVALDTVSDPGRVAASTARALGLFDGTERPAVDALPGFLAQRSLVLVLDNFEHLMGAAPEVAKLVRASPNSRFIVTSRSALRLSGEQEFQVQPLPIKAASAGFDQNADPARQLFIDRAHGVRPDWEPGPDLPAIAEICSLLDGLPLGIELAAARVSILPPDAIRDRLARLLPLPGQAQRDAPDRQRTLEATLDWSHDLLAPAEQRMLAELAVFEGGFDVAQATTVIDAGPGGADADVLDRLVALADHSLLARDPAPLQDAARLEGSGLRFVLLNTVQRYALHRLVASGFESDVRRRHALSYLRLAEATSQHLPGSGQPAWLDRLSLDLPNLRAALRWAIDSGETELALRLAGSTWRFWQIDGHLAEGKDWTDAALALSGAETTTAARLGAITAAGGIAYWQGDQDATLARYSEQLVLAMELGDPTAEADAWFNLASHHYVVNDLAEAGRCAAEARRRFSELGDDRGLNRIAWGQVPLNLERAGPEATLTEIWPILERAVELNDAPYVAIAAGSVAWMYALMGDNANSTRWGFRALMGTYGLRDVAGTTISLPMAAMFALGDDRPAEAATILAAFDALSDRYGVRSPIPLASLLRGADPSALVVEALSPEALAEARERGRRMTLDEVMDLIVGFGIQPAGD